MPIYESDNQQTRWQENESRFYEIWDQEEEKTKKRKKTTVFIFLIIALIISSVSVSIDRWYKWQSLNVIRKLANELNTLKTKAALTHKAYRLEIDDAKNLSYKIFEANHCDSDNFSVLEEKKFENKDYIFISPQDADKAKLKGIVQSYCFDPSVGVNFNHQSNYAVGFGVINVKDMTEGRFDRLSILIIEGNSAEMTLN